MKVGSFRLPLAARTLVWLGLAVAVASAVAELVGPAGYSHESLPRVRLGEGEALLVVVAGLTSGGEVEVRLDAPDAEVVYYRGAVEVGKLGSLAPTLKPLLLKHHVRSGDLMLVAVTDPGSAEALVRGLFSEPREASALEYVEAGEALAAVVIPAGPSAVSLDAYFRTAGAAVVKAEEGYALAAAIVAAGLAYAAGRAVKARG